MEARPFPDLTSIEAARTRITGLAVRTPLRWSLPLSERAQGCVHLKLETMQHTGAFKLRGAANAFLSLPESVRTRGVVTYSTGNHGRALAYVASRFGTRCVVCLSDLVPEAKRTRLAALGAELSIGGQDQDAAMDRAARVAADQGLALIGPIDDPDVIAGQGTIGLEILDDLQNVGTILIPLSGGGLFSGVATAIRACKPQVRLVAVSSAQCPAMRESLAAGRPIHVEEKPSLADSLGGGIGLENRYTFAIVGRTVDEHVTITDDQIADAMRFAFRQERLVLEGGGAATIAALLVSASPGWPHPIVALATGDNVDISHFLRIVQ